MVVVVYADLRAIARGIHLRKTKSLGQLVGLRHGDAAGGGIILRPGNLRGGRRIAYYGDRLLGGSRVAARIGGGPGAQHSTYTAVVHIALHRPGDGRFAIITQRGRTVYGEVGQVGSAIQRLIGGGREQGRQVVLYLDEYRTDVGISVAVGAAQVDRYQRSALAAHEGDVLAVGTGGL